MITETDKKKKNNRKPRRLFVNKNNSSCYSFYTRAFDFLPLADKQFILHSKYMHILLCNAMLSLILRIIFFSQV